MQPGLNTSPYRSHQLFFGDSDFCTPAPANVTPDLMWSPDDPTKAGRRIWERRMTPWINYNAWNLTTWSVNTNLAPGPWGTVDANGNPCGGYTMQKVWQRWDSDSYYWMRGLGGPYQNMTNNLPVPADPLFKPASGSDGSLSVFDLGTGRIYELWQARKQTSSTNYMSALGTHTDRIPDGAWTYVTAGYTGSVFGKRGGHDYGNVTASGVWGMSIQVGIDEFLAWGGLERRGDGTFKRIAPAYDACQHVIGIEYPVDVAENGWVAPAVFSDGDQPHIYGNRYGVRLVLERAAYLSIMNNPTTPDIVKGFATALNMYGGMGTDRSANLAIRMEYWDGREGGQNPIEYGLMQAGYKTYVPQYNRWDADPSAFMSAVPWDKLIALREDWRGTPIGRPK